MHEGDQPLGGVDEYRGVFDGEAEVTLAPGQMAMIDIVLRNAGSDFATVYGVIVDGHRADGARVSAHTCWAMRIAPQPLACTNPESDSSDLEYLDSVCTRPN